jgi:cytochrome c oxidase subunit 4
VANYSESKDVVKQGAEEEALTEYQNKGIISIPPLQTPEVPLITDIPLEEKERIYPQIGNRDIVGPSPVSMIYSEEIDAPLPAIRWGSNTPEILALREKEKGDWHDLSIAEMKQLYRHSFRQTLAEIEASTGEGKRLLYFCLYAVALTTILMLWNRAVAYKGKEEAFFTTDHTTERIKRMINEYNMPYTGIASQYDYENGCWKK